MLHPPRTSGEENSGRSASKRVIMSHFRFTSRNRGSISFKRTLSPMRKMAIAPSAKALAERFARTRTQRWTNRLTSARIGRVHRTLEHH
jgi:hypothetical protein